MTTPTLLDAYGVPLEHYRNRAGVGGPTYEQIRVPTDTELEAIVYGAASNSTRTVWADISKYQHVLTDAYPEPMVAFRAGTGTGTDPNAKANWAWCAKTARIQVVIAYVVHIDGHEAATVSQLKALFGAKAAAKLVIMIDEESGSGFDGSGNHSTGANKLHSLLAAWLGNPKRVIGYANSYDWASCWPTRPAGMLRVTAAYTATWPGTWAQQYYGGVNYPTPAGLPRTMAPFGSNVDLNYAKRSIAQIKTDLGITLDPTDPNWSDMATQAQVQAACVAAIKAEIPTIVNDIWAHPMLNGVTKTSTAPAHSFMTAINARTTESAAQIEATQTVVAAIRAAVTVKPTPGQEN